VIKDLTKCCFNVVAMLEYFFGWVGNPCAPEAAQMLGKGVLIKDRRTFVGVASTGLWDQGVNGAVKGRAA
jgi:hypothetical protein